MSDFAPVIVIEGLLAFGGVLVLYWLHLREMRKIREDKAKQAAIARAQEPPQDPSNEV
jgi:cbb3-type cytochrome oxidase subunit 3